MIYLIQLNDAGMPDQFEYVYFSGDAFDISHIDDLFLDQYLDGYFLASESMGS